MMIGAKRSIRRLTTILQQLHQGELTATANEYDGPPHIRSLAQAVNAVGHRARLDADAELEAEQFRQRARLISATIRRTTNAAQMASHLVRGLGQAYDADRVWLHTVAPDRVPEITVQWHRESIPPLPDAAPQHLEAARSLAERLWDGAQLLTIDDHRNYVPSDGGRHAFELAALVGATASIVVPIGDSSGAFGLLWISMADHQRHWTHTEAGVARYLTGDVAHGLVQAHTIETQAEAVELLRQLDQAKADFISTVSHELRTPLTSITGYLEMLADGDAGQLPDSALQMLAVIDRNATRLRNLIEDLLTQSRIDAGRLRLDVTTVDEILTSVRSALMPLASAASVSLHPIISLAGGAYIQGDVQQLEQVFTNLISNAVKFSQDNGSVTVTCGVDDDSDGVFVEIADNGMGIPSNELDRLFTRFFRASNATAAALPGTGLGLAIVAEIVERHGGEIDVESELDHGSTFTVWLPRKVPLAPPLSP
jgi:two-component system, OmpR family, phosphate regulon sensor histidine kinase PhoR